MRYKALPENYGENANRNYAITLTISLFLFFALLVLFYNNINTPNFDPLRFIWMLIIYSILQWPVMFLFVKASQQRMNLRVIGPKRYIEFKEEALMLEDQIEGRYIKRAYAWEDIERVVVKNQTLFSKFNKNKTFVVDFVLDDLEYSRTIMRNGYSRKSKQLENLGIFMAAMYNESIKDEIAEHWRGTVDYL